MTVTVESPSVGFRHRDTFPPTGSVIDRGRRTNTSRDVVRRNKNTASTADTIKIQSIMSQAAKAVAQTDVRKLESDSRVKRAEIEQVTDGNATVKAHPTDDIARKSLKEDLQQTNYEGYASFIEVA